MAIKEKIIYPIEIQLHFNGRIILEDIEKYEDLIHTDEYYSLQYHTYQNMKKAYIRIMLDFQENITQKQKHVLNIYQSGYGS